MKKFAILGLVLTMLLGCNKHGFIEAKFKLSDNFRIPKWFQGNIINYKHEITITTYSGLSGNKAEICLKNLEVNQIVQCVVGSYEWSEITKKEFEKKGDHFVYPNYSIITADGVSEIFEQKEQSDTLYLTDKINK